MRRIVKAFRRPPTGRMDDRNGGFPRLSDVVAHALRCPASPRRTLKAENLGKPSLWVSIIAPWYKLGFLSTRFGGTAHRDRPDRRPIQPRARSVQSRNNKAQANDFGSRPKSAVLDATLESVPRGITFFDSDLNLSALNQKFLEILNFPTEWFRPEFLMEEVFRYNAMRGASGCCVRALRPGTNFRYC